MTLGVLIQKNINNDILFLFCLLRSEMSMNDRLQSQHQLSQQQHHNHNSHNQNNKLTYPEIIVF